MLRMEPEKVRALVAQLYAARIEDEYDEVGVERLVELGLALDAIHTQLAFEIRDGITVCIALNADDVLLSNAAEHPVEQLAAVVQKSATMQVLPSGGVLVSDEPADLQALAKRALVYHFDGGDCFVLNGQLERVVNPSNFPSMFGTPLFVDLEQALDHYSAHRASRSQCTILSREAWHDERRLILRNRPESVLQRSLELYLLDTLRSVDGVESRREQIIDDRWRTDIKVTWNLHKRISYIEIKWMGRSINREGNALSSFAPKEKDANEGASQLATYLDDSRNASATTDHFGILAVFDARREGLITIDSEVSAEQAAYFRNRDVTYDPDLAARRHDFGRPRRVFLEPAPASAT